MLSLATCRLLHNGSQAVDMPQSTPGAPQSNSQYADTASDFPCTMFASNPSLQAGIHSTVQIRKNL